MSNKKGIKFLLTILLLGLLPMASASVTITLTALNRLSSELEDDIFEKLETAAISVQQYYQYDLDNDDFSVDESDTAYLESLQKLEVELTLFQGDTRIATSLKNADGSYNIGTQASAAVYAAVSAGKSYRSNNVIINGAQYYVYYLPLYDSTGNFWGMSFAGESAANVHAVTQSVQLMLGGISIVLIIVCAAIAVFVAFKIYAPLKKVTTHLTTLADGDLTHEYTSFSNVTEIIQIENASISLQNNLRNVIGEVVTSANSVNSNVENIAEGINSSNRASEGISEAVEEISKGSMEMANSIQNTAESMSNIGNEIDEITELSNTATEAAGRVAEISNTALGNLNILIDANHSTSEISNDVVRGISEASEAVAAISHAADVITDIASQTNLLSLNASIEAARAGEAGRGFAVVASSIQGLAAQSDQSAREIKEIIENIIAKSEENVELANRIKEAVDKEGNILNDVSTSFDEMGVCVGENASAIANINENAGELNQNKMKILDEISTLSSISEENAASCQETTASMQELAATINTISGQSDEAKDVANELIDRTKQFTLE